MSDFEIGRIYPMTKQDGFKVLKAMGLGVILCNRGKPDVTRGRRYLGDNPTRWEFWLDNGLKVSFSVRMNNDINDHFIASVSNGPDRDIPAPQFDYEPTKCIKPNCKNLVAPIGTQPLPGHYKNYRGTGACQQGHNSYFCTICNAPHSFISKVGINHILTGGYGKDFDGTNMKSEKWQPIKENK